MGNAVGPVAVIAAAIFLGYIVMSGRAQGVLTALGAGNTAAAATPASTPGKTDPSTYSGGTYVYNPGSMLSASEVSQASSCCRPIPSKV